ncbi:MAG: hypothetical protein KF819_31010 [Labilithrix sp.]|nr:hypothetical protein [Labilithrix sp.]
MRNRRRATFFALAAALLGVTGGGRARAGGMDPTPERFVIQPPNLPPGQTCQSIAADPGALVSAGLRPQDFPCRPDNASFRNMVSELGFAIAPSAFYPARTTGVGGFTVSLEASYTRISPDRTADGGSAPYWRLGSRGSQDPNTKQFSIVNNAPDSVLQIYAVKARKGLPYGFELAGSMGYISNTTLWVGGGDIRWSLMEGFRTGALGLLPDVSVGGGVRTITGTSKFYLTTAGIDVKMSKAITLADSAQLIPTIGYQRVIIFGDSNVVDATPNVDALQQCGYDGPDPSTGAPTCRNKLPNGQDNTVDFANTFTFQRVRVHRHRGILGLNYKYELIWLGSQIAFDITAPRDENAFLVGSRQWTLSFEGGVSF